MPACPLRRSNPQPTAFQAVALPFELKRRVLKSSMGFQSPEERRRYHREYYQANKDKYLARAKANNARYRERFHETIRSAKAKPCADCNIQYPYYVMQFDHLGNKEFTIASRPYSRSFPKLLEEIAKCEVVCANCHAERTHQRRVSSGTTDLNGASPAPKAGGTPSSLVPGRGTRI